MRSASFLLDFASCSAATALCSVMSTPQVIPLSWWALRQLTLGHQERKYRSATTVCCSHVDEYGRCSQCAWAEGRKPTVGDTGHAFAFACRLGVYSVPWNPRTVSMMTVLIIAGRRPPRFGLIYLLPTTRAVRISTEVEACRFVRDTFIREHVYVETKRVPTDLSNDCPTKRSSCRFVAVPVRRTVRVLPWVATASNWKSKRSTGKLAAPPKKNTTLLPQYCGVEEFG